MTDNKTVPTYPDYNPAIGNILTNAMKSWNNPLANRKKLFRYGKGLNMLDTKLWGLDNLAGELVLFIGEEKQRKTTLVLNILANLLTDTRLEVSPKICIDALESGMSATRYSEHLHCIIASRYLIEAGHIPTGHGRCTVCRAESCKELVLNPKYLNFSEKTIEQNKAINYAYEFLSAKDIFVFDANMAHGDTRNLKGALLGDEPRWYWVADNWDVDIFVIDHVQQYRLDSIGNTTAMDYEKLIQSVSAVGDFVASKHKIVLLLSQISLSSLRDAKSGGKITASGGRKPHQEANAIIATQYEDAAAYIRVSLEGGRSSSTGFDEVPIDMISGTIFIPPAQEEAYNF